MYKSALVLVSLALCALAVDTRYWSQEGQADFEKGTLKKVALRSDGRLALAPSIAELADVPLPYLWAVAAGANGNVYAAGGPSSSKSPVFEVTRGGQSKKLAEVDGMNVFALAVDAAGRVYAASSPDGKIYRISTSGQVETFYDPKAKYIWALAFLPGGDLLAATGDHGELHRIAPNGTGKVWMKLDEDHVRSLVVDSKGTVFVGTEPGGLIVRADAQGKPFVVYQSSKREVTSLAAGKDGSIYAAVIGQKAAGSMLAQQMTPIVVAPPPVTPGGSVQVQVQAARPVAPVPPPIAMSAVPGGSEIIQIDKDGAPVRLWSHATDVVYALALDGNEKLMAGTGNKGNLYRVESPAQSTLLASLPSTQLTGFVREGSRVVAVTGNVGKVLAIGSSLESTGTYESEVFDGGGFTNWGRMHVKEVLNGGTVKYETRSGNLDRPSQMWSDWAALSGGRVVSPAARFVQWRAVLAGGQGDGPVITQSDLAYLPKNVAPRVDVVEATPANYRFPAPSTTIIPVAQTLTLPAIGKPASGSSIGSIVDGATSPALTYARGMIGARWLSFDENGDALEFMIEIKGESEQTWKPLKDKLKDRYYSFDMTAFGDGRYQVRVTASDAPGNPAGQALVTTAVGAPFLIDNTAPVVQGLSGTLAASKVNLKFQAVDALSVVAKAEVSLNGGEWRLVEPTVRLSDSKELEFQLALDRPGTGEVTVAVRVTDEFDNQSVSKIVLK